MGKKPWDFSRLKKKWSGTLCLHKPAKPPIKFRSKKDATRAEFPGKEIVNSKTVISKGKLFASLKKHAHDGK